MNSKKILKLMLVVMLLITVALVGAAAASGGAPAIIGYNIMWAYFLAAFTIASAVLCAVLGMITAPAGVKATLLSLGLVVVIVGVASYVASSHDLQIANIGDGGFFSAEETKITEASVLVTYVVVAGAIIIALLSEVMGVFGSFGSKK